MAGFVDSTVKDIDGRIQELRAELARLEAARTALLGGGGRRAAGSSGPRAQSTTGRGRGRGRRAAGTRSTRAGASSSSGGRRGRRGSNTRATQALELVRERPGITIPEIAERMGIEPNYLYRVMPRLVGEGQVKRDGQGWHPAG